MKLLLVLMSGMFVNVSFAAMPPAAGAGADRKKPQDSRVIHIAPPGKDPARTIVQELEAPPAYTTPTSKASRGSEMPPPCTPLSIIIPNDPSVEVVGVSVPPTPAQKPEGKDAAEFVDLRDGSTALVHVVAAAAVARNNPDADLGLVSTKWCLSNLTDQELETEITRARAWHQKWSQEYHDFTAKISAEQQKIAQARNDQALNAAAIHAIVTAATTEKERLNELFIQHKKLPFPYLNWSTDHLEWVKQVREHNNSKAHLSCCQKYWQSKPACCCGYCNCTRGELCKWSCLHLGGIALVAAFFGPLFVIKP